MLHFPKKIISYCAAWSDINRGYVYNTICPYSKKLEEELEGLEDDFLNYFNIANKLIVILVPKNKINKYNLAASVKTINDVNEIFKEELQSIFFRINSYNGCDTEYARLYGFTSGEGDLIYTTIEDNDVAFNYNLTLDDLDDATVGDSLCMALGSGYIDKLGNQYCRHKYMTMLNKIKEFI